MTKEMVAEKLGKDLTASQVLSYAEEGIAYRAELVSDAIAWGVRAQGNEFKTDTWKAMLEEDNRTIQSIKDIRDTFRKQAEAVIPTGRLSRNTDKQAKSPVSDDYYKA